MEREAEIERQQRIRDIVDDSYWYFDDDIGRVIHARKVYGNKTAHHLGYRLEKEQIRFIQGEFNKINLYSAMPYVVNHPNEIGLHVRETRDGKFKWYYRAVGMEEAIEIEDARTLERLNALYAENNESIPNEAATELKQMITEREKFYAVINPETEVVYGVSSHTRNETALYDGLVEQFDTFFALRTAKKCEQKMSFAMQVQIGTNHWVPVIANTDGEILIGRSIDSETYQPWNRSIELAIEVAMKKHNIEPKEVHYLDHPQLDGVSCGPITAEVLCQYDSKKSIAEQAENLNGAVKQVCENKADTRQEHKHALIAELQLDKKQCADASKPYAKHHNQYANLGEARLQRKYERGLEIARAFREGTGERDKTYGFSSRKKGHGKGADAKGSGNTSASASNAKVNLEQLCTQLQNNEIIKAQKIDVVMNSSKTEAVLQRALPGAQTQGMLRKQEIARVKETQDSVTITASNERPSLQDIQAIAAALIETKDPNPEINAGAPEDIMTLTKILVAEGVVPKVSASLEQKLDAAGQLAAFKELTKAPAPKEGTRLELEMKPKG